MQETQNDQENKDVSGEATTEQPVADPLREAQEKLQEWERKYLYLYAEFENFRKRMDRERQDFLKFGHEGFLRDLISVKDNFERALTHAREQNAEKGSALANITLGVEMILQQFADSLRAQGVTELKALGEKFNPSFHEAVGEEVDAEKEAGTILKEHTKGYLLHGRLLRPARVVIAKR